MSSLSTIYDLVIVERSTRSILLLRDLPGCLPRVHVEGGLRPAHAITRTLLDRWMLQTFLCLDTQGIGDHRCAILELLTPPSTLPSTFVTRPIEDSVDLFHVEQMQLTLTCLAGGDPAQGRFARFGWLEDLKQQYWPHSIEEIEQLNCGTNFSLFRFSSDGARYWFKGVGEPNTHEFAVTKLLGEIAPQFVPHLCASIGSWHAWIANDVDGQPLSTFADESAWSSALRDMASLQNATSSNIHRLVSAGARDLRIPSILGDLPNLFHDAEAAMTAQVSTRATPLSARQMRGLETRVTTVLQDLHSLGIADSLVHADLGSGNVLVTASGTIFIDWAEAYVGNPFISSEQLLATASLLPPEAHDRVRKQQVHRLCPDLSTDDHHVVASQIRILGPLAAATVLWRHGQRSRTPEMYWPALRSLMRHVYRNHDLIIEECVPSTPDARTTRVLHA